jgi:hypothetical protein
MEKRGRGVLNPIYMVWCLSNEDAWPRERKDSNEDRAGGTEYLKTPSILEKNRTSRSDYQVNVVVVSRAVEDESIARVPRKRKKKANSCEVTHKDLEREGGVRTSI